MLSEMMYHTLFCTLVVYSLAAQGARSRASSNLSDVIERGFYDQEDHHLKPSSINTKGPGNEIVEVGQGSSNILYNTAVGLV